MRNSPLKLAALAPLHLELALREVLALARTAAAAGNVPIGAVILSPSGAIVGRGAQSLVAHAHAEIAALTDAAAAMRARRLDGHMLVSSLEPCRMCASAARLHHLSGVAWAVASPKYGAWSTGALGPAAGVYQDALHVHDLDTSAASHAQASAALLRAFFLARRLQRRPVALSHDDAFLPCPLLRRDAGAGGEG